MSVAKLNVTVARDLLNEFRFRDLFNELGWSAPRSKRSEPFTVGESTLSRAPIGELSGIVVYEVESDTGGIPDRKTRALASKETSKATLENVLVFVDNQRTQSVWHWTKREGSKRQAREHHYFKGQPGDLFLSKIASLVVDLSELDEMGHLPLVAAADKVKRALDVERVIKRFFKDYDEQRIAFTGLISGIPVESDRRWYASVLLNRLMFIYFLQRKFFLDGRDDLYLEHKLEENPGTYYRGFLRVLFFEAFAKPREKRSVETLNLTGDIRYLNGGLFLPHSLELRYSIDVPDQAFASLFKLFSHYSWNLNDIPGESDDDINPDVLGYIFEKYINQKEFGAYYTRPEITEYLCEQTIYRLVLDRINEPAIDGLPEGRLFDSVPEMLVKLDRKTARDLLDTVLPSLSILDPAVGSGAFLIAALKTLLTIYSAVVGWLQFHDHSWLDHWLSKRHANIDRVQYAIKKTIITDNLYGVDIMEEATEIAKLRLFMTLVASAQNAEELEPLPNIDFNILAGNSLIGLTRVEDAEFEAKQSLKGKTASLFAPTKTYQQILNERNLCVDHYRHASGYTEDLGFLRDEVDRIENEARPVLSALLRQKFDDLGIAYEKATWDGKKNSLGKPDKLAVTAAHVDALQPFHWGFEFDTILNMKGGFDAIITNPPWEILKPYAKEFFQEHSEVVTKNKLSIREFDSEKARLMLNEEIRDAYLDYQSKFPYQSAYYRVSPEFEHQQAIVNGKKAGSDVNFYKLFLERSHHLLRPGGLCGIVLPGGIYSDLGAKGLRELLFGKSEITGLFGFENRRGIFEGVDSRFKFVVLSFRKGGRTTSFPATFMRVDILDLDRFPEHLGVTLTVDSIRALSPDSLAFPEFSTEAEASLFSKIHRFPPLGAWREGKPLPFSREFMTSDDHPRFNREGIGFTIFEGKMITQFSNHLEAPQWWISEEELAKTRFFERGDWKRYRFAFRRIARNTDNRTMIAAVLPPKALVVHSLFVNVGDILSGPETLFLVAFLNSFVVDYTLRGMVASNVTQFSVYQLPVPPANPGSVIFSRIVDLSAMLTCTTPEFAELWSEVQTGLAGDSDRIEENRPSVAWSSAHAAIHETERDCIRAELDALIAHVYGLTEDEFVLVLAGFPLVSEPQKILARNEFRRLARQGTA